MPTNTKIQWCDSSIEVHDSRPGQIAKAAAWSDLFRKARRDKPWLDEMPRLIHLDFGDGDPSSFEFLKSELIDIVLSKKGRRHCWLWTTTDIGYLANFSTWLWDNHGTEIPHNVWIGTTVTRQGDFGRVNELTKVGIGNIVRFAVIEPFDKPHHLDQHLERLDWLIFRRSSASNDLETPLQTGLVKSLIIKCRSAGVPFFLDRLGSQLVEDDDPLVMKDDTGRNWNQWPQYLRVRQFPEALSVAESSWEKVKPTQGAGKTTDETAEATKKTDKPTSEATKPTIELAEPTKKAVNTTLPTPTATLPNGKFRLLSDINTRQTEWLWDQRIPLGELTIIEGDPGTNKSSLTVDLAARVSAGLPMPGDTDVVSGSVLLLTAEESLEKTVRQRLEAAGGDCSKIVVVEEMLSLTDDVNEIEQVAISLDAKLVIIDPLSAFLGGHAHSEQSVRQALTPFARFAERANVAVVMIRHLTKSGGRRALYRGGGSIGIVAVARSAFLVGKDPDDDNMRVFCHIKSNLGPLTPSVLFEPVSSESGGLSIEWRGECDYTADDLLGSPKNTGVKLEQGKTLLMKLLADGPVEGNAVVESAASEGISLRTLERAKDIIGIVTKRVGFGRGSSVYWNLPNSP